MTGFPIFVDVRRSAPLICGSGNVAVAMVRTLLERAPRVMLAAGSIPCELRAYDGRISLLVRLPAEDDIKGRPLVISATGDDGEDRRVSSLARSLGVPVNVPDKPHLSTFALGAPVDRVNGTLALGPDKAAPMLATHLRSGLEQERDPCRDRVLAIARKYRRAAKRVPADAARRAFWQEVVAGPPAEAILKGDEIEGRRLIEARFDNTSAVASAGRVILIGAGPGDPELLTLKAVRALKSADVVLHDSLVGAGVLDHARREAVIIDVGKRRARHGASQSDINALLIEHASAGKVVARLKGGDAFVFGRAAEEIAAVEAAGIAVEIVPGISAAQACAVDARLPLTARGAVRQITLMTAAACDGEPDHDWRALAQSGQALAIYMGVATGARIADAMIDAGADPDLPVVIVENGGRPERRVIATTLSDLGSAIEEQAVRSPAIIFVGLDWAKAGVRQPPDVAIYCTAPTQPTRFQPRAVRTTPSPALGMATLDIHALFL